MRVLIYVAVYCLLFVSQVEAGILDPKTFQDTVREADLILAGTVTDKQSVWAEDHSTIYTFVTLSDLVVMDGQHDEPHFVLRVEGGEVEESGGLKKKGVKIPGIPDFRLGERVVAFIKNNTQEVCPLVGCNEGLLYLKKDSAGKEKLFTGRDHEIAGIGETGHFLTKPEPRSNDLQVVIEEDDPQAKSLRLQYEATQEQEREKVRAMEFTFQNLEQLIISTAQEQKLLGKKDVKKAQNADPELHRQGRGKGSALPSQHP